MRYALTLTFICAFTANPVHAENSSTENCSAIANKDDRLKCYDRAASVKPPQRSYLTRAWDLDGLGNPDVSGIRHLEPYRKTIC
jgi:hypothetical protein